MSEFEAWLAFRDGERERPIPRITCTQCGGDATSSDIESPPGSPICFDCHEENMRPVIGDVAVGMPFRIPGRDTIYMAMGGTWYCTPDGYDGGPWTLNAEEPVDPLPCKLHAKPVGVLDNETFDDLGKQVLAEDSEYTEGDKVLIEYEYRKRHLDLPKLRE